MTGIDILIVVLAIPATVQAIVQLADRFKKR
jgi:hypothetical protein